jgi:acyl-CoA thioesterase FadM
MAHEDEYSLIEDITAPGGTHGGHLLDYQTQELLTSLWSAYLAKGREGLPMDGAMPALRRVSYALDSEAFVGQELQRGIKVLSRTRRGCTFGVGLWAKDGGQMVHQGEMVTVWVEPGKGAVAIPDDFWAQMEKLEGREIPITERTA